VPVGRRAGPRTSCSVRAARGFSRSCPVVLPGRLRRHGEDGIGVAFQRSGLDGRARPWPDEQGRWRSVSGGRGARSTGHQPSREPISRPTFCQSSTTRPPIERSWRSAGEAATTSAGARRVLSTAQVDRNHLRLRAQPDWPRRVAVVRCGPASARWPPCRAVLGSCWRATGVATLWSVTGPRPRCAPIFARAAAHHRAPHDPAVPRLRRPGRHRLGWSRVPCSIT
jgi:hypothetical protein